MIYKALTVKQPWASLLVAGLKTIENRSWTTNYRGPLAIHAGQGIERNARAMIEKSAGRELTEHEVERYHLNDRQPAGFVLGLVNVVDVVPVEQVTELRHQRWKIGPYCWLVEPLQQFRLQELGWRTPGKLGLWNWDDEFSGLNAYSALG